MMLKQPEDSTRLDDNRELESVAFRLESEPAPVSVKALAWTMVAIIVACIIGQLA